MLSLLDVHARRSLVSLERERICWLQLSFPARLWWADRALAAAISHSHYPGFTEVNTRICFLGLARVLVKHPGVLARHELSPRQPPVPVGAGEALHQEWGHYGAQTFVLSSSQEKNDQGVSDNFLPIQDILLVLLSASSSFSTSLQQILQEGCWLTKTKCLRKFTSKHTYMRQREEIPSYFMCPFSYTSVSISLRASIPKFLSPKTPSIIPVSSLLDKKPWEMKSLLQEKSRKKKKIY